MENRFQPFPENRHAYNKEQQNILEREAADIDQLETQLRIENSQFQEEIASWASGQDRESQKDAMQLAAGQLNNNLEQLAAGIIRKREINRQLAAIKEDLLQIQHN